MYTVSISCTYRTLTGWQSVSRMYVGVVRRRGVRKCVARCRSRCRALHRQTSSSGSSADTSSSSNDSRRKVCSQQGIASAATRRYAPADGSSTTGKIAADLRPSADGSAVRTSLNLCCPALSIWLDILSWFRHRTRRIPHNVF